MAVYRRRFLARLGAVSSAGLAGCQTVLPSGDDATPTPTPVSTAWPMYRSDPQNTGTTDASGPTPPVTEQWRVQPTDDGRIDGTSPTVVGTTVYIGVENTKPDGGFVDALSIADGSIQWRYPIGESSSWVDSTPAVTDDTVYAANHDGRLTAFAPPENTERWDFGTKEDFPWVRLRAQNEQWSYDTQSLYRTSPTVADGTVFVGTEEALIAFDAHDGTVRWRVPIDASTSPAVADGTVCVGGYGSADSPGHVVAVSASDGTLQWRSDLGTNRPRWLAMANSTVYVSTVSDQPPNTLYALSAASGTRRWTTQPVATAPAVTEESVYVGSKDGRVYAFATGDGSEQWRFPIRNARKRTTPQSSPTRIRTRRPRRTGGATPVDPSDTPTPYGSPPIPGSPVVGGDTVYVDGGGYIQAVGASDGTERWAVRGGYTENSSPAVVDSTLYFVSGNDGSVVAITEA